MVTPSAFGGSRAEIAKREIDRNRASALAQAQAQAFGQAQQQQLARAQSAAQGLGSLGMQQAKLGEAFQGLNINDINMLSALGGQEQQAASERTGRSKTDTIPECHATIPATRILLRIYSKVCRHLRLRLHRSRLQILACCHRLVASVWDCIVLVKLECLVKEGLSMNVMNRKLFANRNARRRLANMGGIMTSSPELMQAVGRCFKLGDKLQF